MIFDFKLSFPFNASIDWSSSTHTHTHTPCNVLYVYRCTIISIHYNVIMFNGVYQAFSCWGVFHALKKMSLQHSKRVLWSLTFIQPGWPPQSPQNMYLNHLFITVTVSLEVQTFRHTHLLYPLPPAATREFLVHLPSKGSGRQPRIRKTTTPTHTATSHAVIYHVHQIMVPYQPLIL